MKINWKKPPEFVVVGGSEWFLIERFVKQISASALEAGLVAHTADSPSGIVDSVAPNFWEVGSTQDDSIPFVVFRGYRAQEQLPPDFSLDQKSCILYVVDGAINKKSCPVLPRVSESFVVKLNKFHGSWNKSVQHAVGFLEQEFSSHGISSDEKVLESMVRTAGFDLGTLRFEVEKAVYAAKSLGKDSVDLEVLRGTIKPTNHFDMTPMRDSLSKLQASRFLQFTHRAYTRSVSDPTMIFLRGKGGVGDLAMVWLQTALLMGAGSPASAIAKVTGMPVWAVTRDSFPAVRRWGLDRLKILVSNLAEVDSGYVLGCPNPRVKLESAVVSAMESQ